MILAETILASPCEREIERTQCVLVCWVWGYAHLIIDVAHFCGHMPCQPLLQAFESKHNAQNLDKHSNRKLGKGEVVVNSANDTSRCPM